MFLTNSAQYGLPEFNRPPWQTYGSAVLAAAAATAASLLLQEFTGGSAPWMIAFLPVILIAWYSGTGPCLVAALAGAAGVLTWFVRPSGFVSFLTGDGALGLAAFLVAALAVAALAEAYRRRLGEANEQIATYQQHLDQVQFNLSHLRTACDSLRDDARREAAQRKIVEEQVRTAEERIRAAEAAAGIRLFDWDLRRNSIYV